MQSRRVGVLFTGCATCGSVDVYLGGAYLGRVSTATSSTAHRQLRWLPLGSARTGTLVLRAVSGRRVDVDGIALLH